MYKLHDTCRACGSKDLQSVINFGWQPLANDFKTAEAERAGAAPLHVLFCRNCTLAQLSVVVDPHILYDQYAYVTSPSAMMRAHFHALLRDLQRERGGHLGDLLEIGSNDGALLGFLGAHANSVCGVDPAENLVEIARSRNIPTLCALWSSDTAQEFNRKFDIIIARHVFAHCDDWWGFIKGVDLVAHEGTVIAVEVPYAGDLLDRNQFDTIYHEHLSYVSIQAVNAFLAGTPFYLAKVIGYPIHDGAMLLILRRRDGHEQPVPNDSITADRWTWLGGRALEMMQKLRHHVITFGGSKAYRVCGYGASAKSTLWLNGCRFTKANIEFVHDVTPQKQGKLCSGTDIPITDNRTKLESATHAVLFAWNYAAEIAEKEANLRANGLKFIVPVPDVKIV